MIPNNDNYEEKLVDDIESDFEVQVMPSFTYRLNKEKNMVLGRCDELEAVKQAVYKILNTERYESLIYSWDYGIELQDLVGEDMDYVISEIGDRITEALLQDDRIEEISNIEIEILDKNKIHTTFTVVCEFGEFEADKEMSI